MKRIVSLLLVLTIICCNGFVSFAAGTQEAQITSPSDGEWLDPYKTITIKWTTPTAGMNYQITIQNVGTGNYVVQNKSVSGNSYSIASNTLDFEQQYKIWVGTFNGSSAIGRGDSITIKINDRLNSQKIYEEAQFTYPTNNVTVPYDEDLTLRFTGNNDLAYNVSVRDLDTNKTIVDSSISRNVYIVKKNLLEPGHEYKAWVGTYKKASAEKIPLGPGNSITFKTKEASSGSTTPPPRPPITPDPAAISYPSNKQWIDPTKDITINWNSVSTSGIKYCLSINNDVTGEYVCKDKYITSTSYTISANTLPEQQRYKVSLTTYLNNEALGSSVIYFNTNDVDYNEAVFVNPVNNDYIDAKSDFIIRISNVESAYRYRISIVDTATNKSIVKNTLLNSSTYYVSANTLEAGKQYKLWVGTYLNSSDSNAVGVGSTVYVNTLEEDDENDQPPVEPEITNATVEAQFTSPGNYDVVDYASDLKLNWSRSDVDTYYSLTIKDRTTDSFILRDKLLTDTSYTIKSSKLNENHEYTAWIGTYSNTTNEKVFIGYGDEVYFSTDGDTSTPILITSLTADMTDCGLSFEYEIVGDKFSYATYIVTDSNGKTLFDDKIYQLSGYLTLDTEDLQADTTYTCELQTYNTDGEKAAYKALEYSTEPSSVSMSNLIYPKGELQLGNDFSIAGTITSSYPIMKAEIVIFEKDNENNIEDMIEINTYSSPKAVYELCIDDYSSSFDFASIPAGEYTYKIVVYDTLDNMFPVVKSNFSIAGEKTASYYDVPYNHKNYDAIMSLSDMGILEGDETGYFRPNDSITRAEFVKIICLSFGLKEKANDISFSDTRSHWAKDYIRISASNGIINGVGNNNFAPEENITYQQIAKIIVNIKGWEANALKLGGYPDGYVKVMINNNLFENSTVDSSEFKYSSYYDKSATRANVAQIVHNALLHNGNDETVIAEPTQQQTLSTNTPYMITADLGENVTGTNNPSPQQIYNYVYNRIKDREIYQKDPNVLNAIMAMIWTENGGLHYENGKIACRSNSSSKDYGICQLNDSVYPDAEYWGWRDNLNTGIDKYSSSYWMCMGEEAGNEAYAQIVENAVKNGYAQSYQEARARSAYCMYNYNKYHSNRWFTENDSRDDNFFSHYTSKKWAKTLTKASNSGTTSSTTPSSGGTTSTAQSIKYDGKTYIYEAEFGNKQIKTKSYSSGDYANIKEAWKILYGYNPTFYGASPLYGRLEWYCPGIGSLFVEYDMRNLSDDDIHSFNIYRFTQDGREFPLPIEYIGYNKLASNMVYMTKHGDVALIGIKNLANIFACDIDFKNHISLNRTIQNTLQQVTDELNNEDNAYKSDTIMWDEFVKLFQEQADEQVDNKRKSDCYLLSPYPNDNGKYINIHSANSSTNWCVLFATWLAGDTMLKYGIAKDTAKKIVPYEASTATFILRYVGDQSKQENKNKMQYFKVFVGYTSVKREGIQNTYEQNCFDFNDYIPQAGDFVIVETNGSKSDGADHIGIVYSVDKENKTFITVEGNTDINLTTNNRVVKKHTYKWEDDRKTYYRSGSFVYGFVKPPYMSAIKELN